MLRTLLPRMGELPGAAAAVAAARAAFQLGKRSRATRVGTQSPEEDFNELRAAGGCKRGQRADIFCVGWLVGGWVDGWVGTRHPEEDLNELWVAGGCCVWGAGVGMGGG